MSHDAEQVCRCVADHRPAPMELHRHHVLPLYLGGPDAEWNAVYICPSTHANVHEVLRLLLTHGRLSYYDVGKLSDRSVSRYAYALAVQGFDRFTTPPSPAVMPAGVRG